MSKHRRLADSNGSALDNVFGHYHHWVAAAFQTKIVCHSSRRTTETPLECIRISRRVLKDDIFL